MRVAIYIRVSTEEQAKEGYSISAQKQKLKAFCIAQDWTIAGLYADEGVSAKDTNRLELQRMLEDIKAGLIDVVLVWRLDRLTRSVFDLYKLLNVFEKYNCKFKSATEVFDTTTAMGRMFITIVAAMAQWERENLGERISFGVAEKVRQGRYAHNNRIYGYDLDRKSGILTIREDEAKVVRLIVDLYLNKGYGANRICKYLNERGIKTRDGNMWRDKPLIQLLKNPIYCGTIRWRAHTNDPLYVESKFVPPIIDKSTFEKIQETIKRRAGTYSREVYSDYYFSGKIRCNNCGYPMTGYVVYGKLASGETVRYKNYRCLHKKTGQCKGSRAISERNMEKAFLDYLDKLDFSTVLDEVTNKGIIELNKENNKDERADLLAQLEKIEKRKKKWQYAWSEDMISNDDFVNRMNEEREKEEKIKAQLEQITVPEESQEVDKNELMKTLREIRKNWEHLDEREKKSLVQQTVKQIYYGYDGNQLVINSINFL